MYIFIVDGSMSPQNREQAVLPGTCKAEAIWLLPDSRSLTCDLLQFPQAIRGGLGRRPPVAP